MNILAHDLPIDEPRAFYEQQSREALRHYPAIGNDDREKSYFLRMLLGCYQAAEYLSSREDFNGILVVVGNSQGGMQALATAALHPKVTAVMINVPAGCDHTAPAIGRQPGWPRWWYAVDGKDADQVRQTSRYFDLVNFAGRVKCPVLIGGGLIDTTCPPSSVYAAYNQVTGPKEIVPLVGAGHGNINNSHSPYYKRSGAWLTELKAGREVPAP
jgi:cephalosporin-C deacetylase-like acetyl esterase